MKSIGKKILNATLYWVITLIVLMTVMSIVVVNKIINDDSKTILTSACENETLGYNNEFKLLENSVATIYEYVEYLEGEAESEEELLSSEFSDKVQDMTLSIANRTDGAMAVYFRYNPELTGNGTQGFFWSRNNDSESFSYFEPTDILQYDQNDTEHVGWFYEPKKKREPMWMAPYFNKNLNVFMISYVVPYYTESGDFLGVIGMDIDFNKIIQRAADVTLYKSGEVRLIDLSTYLIYSANENDSVIQENLSTSLYNHITTIDRDDDTLRMTDNNGKKIITCVSQLRNGMRLLLSVSENEVYSYKNNLIWAYAVIMILSIAITVLYIAKLTNKMIYPLKKLTRITGKYAKGDWDETFISKTGDEIQELSESISAMAGTTKTYIELISEKAMIDSLTGVKNKNSYLSFIKKYEDINTRPKNYAVAVCDINFLKTVNDNYGHEDGDRMIKMASEHICTIFEHSPVFRIGGDEFCVILENHDYKIRKELFERFSVEMKELTPVVDDICLEIPIGMASYPDDGKNYEDIFNRADQLMYTNKRRMKGETDGR